MIEESGISTVYLGSCRDMMVQVRPPRAAFLNFPLGRPCGRPHNADLQRRIVTDALNLLVTAQVPGTIADLPYKWGSPFDWQGFMEDLAEMLKEEGVQPREWKPKV